MFLIVPVGKEPTGYWHHLGEAFLPFNWAAWGCIFASLLFGSTVLFLIEAAQPVPAPEFFRSFAGLLSIVVTTFHGFFG